MVLLWSDRAFDDVTTKILLQKFPYLSIEIKPVEALQVASPHFCQQVDIIYADTLSAEQLEVFSHVKWIHCPGTHFYDFIPLIIHKRQNILLTRTLVHPSVQYFDFATTLLFASCQGVLFRGKKVPLSLKPFSKTVVVQIGLSTYMSELAKRAKNAGMRVIGIATPPSFHAFYDKVLPIQQLHSVLPAADIVIVTPGEEEYVLGQEELALMKKGSFLCVLGESYLIDSTALFQALSRPQSIAVWLDFSWRLNAEEQKWNWQQFSSLLHTPGLIYTMDRDQQEDFRFFLWNLDCFYHRRYLEMNGLWQRGPARRLERRAFSE